MLRDFLFRAFVVRLIAFDAVVVDANRPQAQALGHWPARFDLVM